MKKLLPIILGFIICCTLFLAPKAVYAQSPAPGTQLQPANPAAQPSTGAPASVWVVDPETTFVGKNAARSGNLLNWTFQNYNWVCVNRVGDRQCDNNKNPLAQFWSQIVLFIVVPLLFLVILLSATIIIITRGRSLTIMRFIPRFVVVLLLIVFSYAILQFLNQIADLVQGFFLRTDLTKDSCPPACISNADLLYVGWDYEKFVGLRLLGDFNAESAFISLLLTKLTAITYYVMFAMLIIRKVILWFFIIISPIFPLLLLYYPTRNTGKIWIGEFFRWLLYAPLFAIFLQGLVSLWRSKIPLVFSNPDIGNASKIIYPTAINIILGGPQQLPTPTNSVNLTETFALYVVALIMLWVVMLLPWILLQIFLDYANNYSASDSAVMKTLVSMSANKQPAGSPPPVSPPSGEGTALNLPFARKFNVPVSLKTDYKPAGAAMQMPQVNSTANAQALGASKLSSVPSMRDIAKFETAMLSKDQSQMEKISQVTNTLTNIANPASTSSTVEREHYEEISKQLTQQSLQGNVMASNILNAAKVVSKKSSGKQEVKSVLQQIANPSTATNLIDRAKFTKIHEALEKESKEKNNKVATSILNVNERTSEAEISKLQTKLSKESNNATLSSVNSAVETSQIKAVLKQVSNPASTTGENREKMTHLKSSLTKASQQGNVLAKSLLSVNETTSSEELEKLEVKLKAEREKGVGFATEIASMAQSSASVSLPAMNRVQTVKQEDYMAVKEMWKQNYKNMAVPAGIATSRTEWVKDDIAKIEAIIGLLSSTDPGKSSEGMQQVSDILPFLLVGGFSQTEIIAYLKAKLDAAREVVEEISKEEETQVSVSATQSAQATKTMAATMDETPEKPATQSASSTSSEPEENESMLANMGTGAQAATASPVTPAPASSTALTMANLAMPKMKDIARYEGLFLSQDQTKRAEIKQIHDILQKIANPALVPAGPERDHFETLRKQLMEESAKGNMNAKLLLAAAGSANRSKTTDIAKTLQHVANPSLATTEEDRKRFEALHNTLAEESSKGNELAKSVLAVQTTTTPDEIEALSAKLREAKGKGESVATSLLATSEESDALPDANSLQQVAHEDYDEVKKVWEENYRTLPVPAPFSNTAAGRIEWITADISTIQGVVDLLNSGDTVKRKEGLQKVSGILPFLLLGGFSNQEMVQYLSTKLEAAKTVLAELQKDESSSVSVAAPAQAEKPKTMAAPDETPSK